MIDTIEIPYYTSPMAMGKRPRDRQPTMWVPMTELPTSASHPFYARLNQLLHDRGFDDNESNAVSPTRTTPAGCAARTCAVTTIS
jgi:hypothetical protein